MKYYITVTCIGQVGGVVGGGQVCGNKQIGNSLHIVSTVVMCW